MFSLSFCSRTFGPISAVTTSINTGCCANSRKNGQCHDGDFSRRTRGSSGVCESSRSYCALWSVSPAASATIRSVSSRNACNTSSGNSLGISRKPFS